MQSFEEIYQHALERKGGEDQITALLPTEIPHDRYLAAMTRAIFKAGFIWKIIARKWDGVAALIYTGVITLSPTSKHDLKLVHKTYNSWREESGFSNAQISRILSLSIG